MESGKRFPLAGWLGIGVGLGIGVTLSAITFEPVGALGLLGMAIAMLAGNHLLRSHGGERSPQRRAIADGGEPGIELVEAIIRPGKLNDVKQALAAAGAPSLTVSNVSGRGSQPTETGQWRGEEYIVDLHQKVKIECAVRDETTDVVVNAIQEAAHTGEPGDGKIFVVPVLDACRVSTDERGLEAM